MGYSSVIYTIAIGRSNMMGLNLYIMNIFMAVLIIKIFVFIPHFLEDITRSARWVFSYAGKQSEAPNAHTIPRAQFISRFALGLAAIPFATALYGMAKTAFDYSIKKVTVKIPHLPAEFDGFTIVQISDLHTGSQASTAPYKRAVELINEQKADVIFMTGDLVNNVADEAVGFVDVLKELKSPNGVFSTLGNHDYGDYIGWDSPAEKDANLERVKNIHAQMGWNLLNNRNARLTRGDKSIAIIGVENWGAKHGFTQYGNLHEAYKGSEDADVKLLLSHDPSHWDAQVTPVYKDIDVTFSGHTHGFQLGIEIPGFKWSPSQYLYKQWGGLYTEGNQHIYVNRGLGFLGYMGRIGIPPEITVMTLKRA